jgi:cytochrome c-type biogenesis protein CcmH
MATFIVLAVVLNVLALGIVLLPLWRRGRLSKAAIGTMVLVCIGAVPAYWQISNWDFSRPVSIAAGNQTPDVAAMVAGLEARMAEDPSDVEGWTMLGRSYLVMRQYPEAIEAYKQAWERSDDPSTELKLAYAEAQAFVDQSSLSGMAGQLVEEVLAIEPMNARALWYGGLVALLADRPNDARTRWTQLLSLNPPEEVASVLKAQLAQLDGPAAVAAAEPADTAAASTRIDLSVALGEAAAAKITPQTTLFIIARDPAGGPPVAVTRHRAAALPGQFTLTDGDTMLAGRLLSQFEQLEVVARLSLSGEPMAKPGDWFASTITQPGGPPLQLLIDQLVE